MPAFVAALLLSHRFPSPHSKLCRRRRAVTASASPVVIGLNEYSHDTSIALIEERSGELVFAASKERLTRHKHHGEDPTILIPHALSAIRSPSESLEDVCKRVHLVVANNHHFRIAPFEKRLPFQIHMRYVPPTYASKWNLIGAHLSKNEVAPNAHKIEVSHHLAHAFSAIHSAPFDRGLVLIMDGMGDSLDDWLQAQANVDAGYHTELTSAFVSDHVDFVQFPEDVMTRPGISFREAETAYTFERDGSVVKLSRVYKRWTPENAPSELDNHSFEDMYSAGALYSRVSAILFGDWNACGKVMGLAPYAKVRNSKDDANDPRFFMSGHLEDGSLCMKGGQTKGLEELERTMSDCDLSEDGQKLRLYFENLAYSVQSDLEQVVTSAVTSLLERTGHSNLIFSGGVALNSTLNGILSAHPLVGKFYVPPYPGDEGVAVGCAAFGRALLAAKDRSSMNESWAPETVLPYLGKEYTTADFMEAIESFHPWIEFQCADVSKHAAEALTSSKVVAWFNGRAEFGPRALGNRSILADPRSKSMTDLVNSVIKKRESFRPFAPTVLAEFAAQYFEDCDSESSPFMSLTKQAKLPHSIEAVVHVDGTSRLQTLKREQNPRYYDLIMEFYKLSGVPMVMNTSFNVAGEPIVESPSDAIKSFLGTEGIDFLMFPGIEIRRHTRTALSDEDVVSTACASFHSRQVQDSYGSCIHTRVSYVPKFEVIQLGSDENASEETIELIDGLELQILESIHESQSSAVLDIIVEICGSCDDGNMDMELEKPTRENVIERLLDLYRNRLILVEPGDGSELEDSITAQDKQMASTNCGVPR